jgi:AraC-like DNA-binding protein
MIIYMDDFSINLRHTGHLQRQFPSALPVDSIGYIPHKTSWIDFQFHTYNFSFILSGSGEYRLNGVGWRVQAPCVITQAPGRLQEYGPTGKRQEWEELYLIYEAGKIPILKKMGMLRDTPVWNIKDIGPTRARMLELRQAAASGREHGFADRVDRLCELLVIESILGEAHETLTPEERAIDAIRDQMKMQFLQCHDFHELARAHGLSHSTFRRYWATRVGVPPAHYLMRRRVEEACRLLVETRLKIGEIAAAAGFRDPLYFSRRFRLETGVTAADYRRSHQSPLSLEA